MTRYAKSHTHTQITVIIDTSKQCYNAAIFSWRDMQNHTHTSILLAGRQSCCSGHSTSSIFIDGLENWFLAWNETTKLPSLTCTFGLQENSASGRRKHRKNNDHWTQMKDCSSWKQWSLDTGWNCSSWCQEVLGYLPQTRLQARGMSQGFFLQLC
jgi:hypothetical protein